MLLVLCLRFGRNTKILGCKCIRIPFCQFFLHNQPIFDAHSKQPNTVEEKHIDETRQGEFLMLPVQEGHQTSKKLLLESYGCQMNFSDSEIVASILAKEGYTTTRVPEEADLILLNTCAIRDNAEQRIRGRLEYLRSVKKKKPSMSVGVLGCMAERLREKLLDQEKLVDLVVGPDAYRDLPNLLQQVETGQKAVNVLLSREETYAEITPVRLDTNGVNAFISIMRGCDNMCSFCVVPFTRGRERSRDPESIVAEATDLFNKGFREVTLLGQNVDSYKWNTNENTDNKVNFAHLLQRVASIHPDLRIRYSTSHPKDMSDEVLEVMSSHENICKYIHLPVQSGHNDVLKRMNRGYTREWYLERIAAIRRYMPDCAISTDVIAGFCSENDEEHQATVSIMREVVFDMAYMFKYSERPRTLAERKFQDDVPEETKTQRLQEIIDVQMKSAANRTSSHIGKIQKVLIEGFSKRSHDFYQGRNSQNVVAIFPISPEFGPGDYVEVKMTGATSVTLTGDVVSIVSKRS